MQNTDSTWTIQNNSLDTTFASLTNFNKENYKPVSTKKCGKPIIIIYLVGAGICDNLSQHVYAF